MVKLTRDENFTHKKGDAKKLNRVFSHPLFLVEALRNEGRCDIIAYGIAFSRKRCKALGERL